MIERHVTFHVLPGKEDEFKNFFQAKYRPEMEKTKGFIKAELLNDEDIPQELKMVLRFESTEAAASWRSSDRHQALKPELKALYDGSELKVYIVLG